MRKGSLKLLLSSGLVALGTAVYAASPVLDTLPIVVISDKENQSATEDWNFFVYSDAFAFGDYVEDADTPDSALKWTFDIGPVGSTGDLTINDIASISTTSDDPLNPTNPINIGDATFREIALSPGLSTDPIVTPFPTPTEITGTMGQPADIDGDSVDDKLVGELVVSFVVSDTQAVDTGETFVWTYDTDLGGASAVEDQLLDQGMTFEPIDLVISSTGGTNPGDPDWVYNNWSDTQAGSTLTENWLTDATSGTTGSSPYDTFEITGAGNASQNGSFGAALGEWVAPGDSKALLQPGKVYSARAALGFEGGDKNANDQPRIAIHENTVANVNQTYVVNAATANTGITGPSPFLPPSGSTREYLSTVDPIDADLAFNDDIGDGEVMYYLFKFDFVNLIAVAVRTATMSSFEVGSVDSGTYNQNESAIKTYGDGSGESAFTTWGEMPQVAPISLLGGSQLLTPWNAPVITAGSVVTSCANQTDGSVDISFGETANYTGTQYNDLEVVAGAAYRADYSIAVNGGSSAGLSPGNTYGIPSLRIRAATPIPSFSIEYMVTPRNTNGFPTEDTAAIHQLFWTASTQYPDATTGNGDEDDQQLIFGIQDFEWTDGTATLDSLTVYEVNSADPNVDY